MTRIEDCPRLYQLLKESVDQLAMLLSVPEPSSMTWLHLVDIAAKNVSDLYRNGATAIGDLDGGDARRDAGQRR